MMGCCFSAVIGLTACGDDEDELTQKEPVVNPIPDPEPEVTLPEITGFGHAIAFGGNSITGQDASYAIPLEVLFSPTLDGKTLTVKDVTIYIDGKEVDSQPWAELVTFKENMKDYAVGDHKLTVSSTLSCEGYKDTKYTFGEEFSFYVSNEAPKHRVMLKLVQDHIQYGEEYTDPISGITTSTSGVVQGSSHTSEADDYIVWSIGERVIHGGTYTDPISGITVDLTDTIPGNDDLVTFRASLIIDPESTNFEAEIDRFGVRWGSRDTAPSMSYSVPYKNMNDIDYIYVVYTLKGKKDGREFVDNEYHEKTFYLKKSDL